MKDLFLCLSYLGLKVMQVILLIYNMWIAFRVLHGWGGYLLAVLGIVSMPITGIVLPLAMLFFPSHDAGVYALWPGILLICLCQWLVEKIKPHLNS
jgi:hypothetical protein